MFFGSDSDDDKKNDDPMDAVRRAQEKISIIMQRQDAKAGSLQQNYQSSEQRVTFQGQAAALLGEVDVFETAAQYQEQLNQEPLFTGLAQRLAENLANLTNFIKRR